MSIVNMDRSINVVMVGVMVITIVASSIDKCDATSRRLLGLDGILGGILGGILDPILGGNLGDTPPSPPSN